MSKRRSMWHLAWATGLVILFCMVALSFTPALAGQGGGFTLPFTGAYSVPRSPANPTGSVFYLSNANTGNAITGQSASGIGVYGSGAYGTGVSGDAQQPGACGVVGYNYAASGIAVGVFGVTYSGAGVAVDGWNKATTGLAYGIVGRTDSPNGVGVTGYNAATAGNGAGVAGIATSPNGYGGLFAGNVKVSGAVIAGVKLFKIDHPLDPAHKYLLHSCVESSDMKTIYDGIAILDTDGKAEIQMPAYMQALNRDFRYQLTALDNPAPNLHVSQEMEGNHFQIAGGAPGQRVCWQVTGIRQDAYAQAHPLVVEQEKPGAERGKYLYPVESGKSPKLGIDYDRIQEMSKHVPALSRPAAAQPHSPSNPTLPPRPTQRADKNG